MMNSTNNYNISSLLINEDTTQDFSTIEMFDNIVQKQGHKMSQSFSSFASTYLVIIVVTSILCNLLLIGVILSKQSLRSTYTHTYVINLAVSDLVTALTAVTFDIDFIMRRVFTHGKFACTVMQVSFWVSLPSSVISLFLLTMERFSAVMFPFARLQVIHNKYITPLVISVVWLYTIITSVVPLIINSDAITVDYGYCYMDFPTSYGIFQIVVNFTIPTILIIVMNIVLYVRAMRNKGVAKQDIREARTDGERRESLAKMKEIRDDIRAATRILALVLVTLICWFAYIVLVVSNIACGVCHSEEMTYTGNLINYTCIALNPILYGLTNSKIRRELCRCFAFIDKFNLLPDPSATSSYNSSRRTTCDYYLSRRTTDYNLDVPVTHPHRRGAALYRDYTPLPTVNKTPTLEEHELGGFDMNQG